MYRRRLYILISISVLVSAVCLFRLGHLQLISSGEYRQRIQNEHTLSPKLISTLRGRILDRNEKVLASDKAAFYLCVKYQPELLSNVQFFNITSELSGLEPEELKAKIEKIYNWIWQMRQELAWRKKCPDSELKIKYEKLGRAIPIAEVLKDFGQKCPDAKERDKLTEDEDIIEMYESHRLIELKTEEQRVKAQSQLSDIDGVEILSRPKRVYPYKSSACQVIGWVGPARQSDMELFADDEYSKYLGGEISGRQDGVEKVCEAILRGSRGKVIYNRDDELVFKKLRQFGEDVALSLDIELQRQIEIYLDREMSARSNVTSLFNAAVVLDVATGDILAMVSLPVYDLNTVRQKYEEILNAPSTPMMSKALYKLYPPGSVIKPFVLIAGMEEKKTYSTEIIPCPDRRPPENWPACWIIREGSYHDSKWQGEGGNIARNAIKGSCNIYFSRLADRLEPSTLQNWLLKFGFGRKVVPGPTFDEQSKSFDRDGPTNRNMIQSAGCISTPGLGKPQPGETPTPLDNLDKLAKWERKLFGIGQGNLKVTVLQVANAMAAIARDGIYKNPRLFLSESDYYNEYQFNLGVSEQTLAIVRDGMNAVVNEYGGTAYSAFDRDDLDQRDMDVYGKTGSTQGSISAWFAGFAKDRTGRTLSVAIVVEGGQSGARDAAPLGYGILKLCNEAGYIGEIKTQE